MMQNHILSIVAVLAVIGVVVQSAGVENLAAPEDEWKSNQGMLHLYKVEPELLEAEQAQESLLRALRSTYQRDAGNKQRFFPYYKGLGRK